MPDAMEIIFQTALDLGRHGAVSIYNSLFRIYDKCSVNTEGTQVIGKIYMCYIYAFPFHNTMCSQP